MPLKKVDPMLAILKDAVAFEFRRKQFASLEKEREPIFHVSDYANECMRNSYYKHMKSIPKANMDTNQMSIVWGGEAVHQLMDSVDHDETKMSWDIVADCKPEDKSEIHNILHGECDAFYDFKEIGPDGDKDNQRVIVDYKTWLSKGYPKKKASDTHVRQVNLYNYLLKKNTGTSAKYGAVIYLDVGERMQKPLIFIFELDPLETVEADLKRKHAMFEHAMKTGELPERTKTWLCDGYCPYAKRCSNEDQLSPPEVEAGLA